MKKSTLAILTFVVVSALLLSACQGNSSTTQNSSEPISVMEKSNLVASPVAESTTNTLTTTPTSQTSKEVSVKSSYQSPAGPEDVKFTLVVDANGVITDAKTEVLGKAPISIKRQEAFAAEAPTVLKGKKLSELTSIDRVGGSSLTTGAFNKGLADLKAQL